VWHAHDMCFRIVYIPLCRPKREHGQAKRPGLLQLLNWTRSACLCTTCARAPAVSAALPATAPQCHHRARPPLVRWRRRRRWAAWWTRWAAPLRCRCPAISNNNSSSRAPVCVPARRQALPRPPPRQPPGCVPVAVCRPRPPPWVTATATATVTTLMGQDSTTMRGTPALSPHPPWSEPSACTRLAARARPTHTAAAGPALPQ
jgi:hypothetical protein